MNAFTPNKRTRDAMWYVNVLGDRLQRNSFSGERSKLVAELENARKNYREVLAAEHPEEAIRHLKLILAQAVVAHKRAAANALLRSHQLKDCKLDWQIEAISKAEEDSIKARKRVNSLTLELERLYLRLL